MSKNTTTVIAKNAVLPVRGRAAELVLSKGVPKDVDAVAIAVFSSGDGGLELAGGTTLDALFSDEQQGTILRQLEAVGATGKKNEVTRIPGVDKLGSVIAVGLGIADELDDETLRRATGTLARSLKDVHSVATTIAELGVEATVVGFSLGAYSYTGMQAKKEPDTSLTINVVGADKGEFVKAQVVAEAVLLARDFVNAPSSQLYPESYAVFAANEAKKFGVAAEILDEQELEKRGFGGILAVGQGSSRKPRLLKLTWTSRKADRDVALVGKGITFDTGGISLKPGANMDNMISDMGGSATMLATIIGAARLSLPINVTAYLPMAENMPSGEAFRPGDVITHYGGITSEILNTDAEGRLVLADAIALASESQPDYLIDAATLTGAQLVALGLRTAGVMGTEQLRDRIAATGREVGEQAWAMPLPEELDQDIKSEVADLRNVTNSRFAGMSAAGRYLQEFVGTDIEWAHLDIAGPAYNTASAFGYTPKRATGAPVRTLLRVLENLAN